MQKITKKNYLSIALLINLFCGIMYTQEDQCDQHSAIEQNDDSNETSNKSERLKQHYEALGLTENADLEKVAYAYHNLAAQAHAIIESKQSKLRYQDQNCIVDIYCERWIDSNDYINSLKYGYSYIEPLDNDRDEVVAAQEQLQKIRKAYEAISGNKLEKIKKIKKMLTTKGLNQKALNDGLKSYFDKQDSFYARYFPGLLHIIKKQREQAQMDIVQDLDDSDFVFGEENQNTSYLSEENKIKAQIYLEKIIQEQKLRSEKNLEEVRLLEEKRLKEIKIQQEEQARQWEIDKPKVYAQIALNTAIASGAIAVLGLIVRAILLQE